MPSTDNWIITLVLWETKELDSVCRAAFWEIVKFNYPTHQIVYCTEEALKTLEFEGKNVL